MSSTEGDIPGSPRVMGRSVLRQGSDRAMRGTRDERLEYVRSKPDGPEGLDRGGGSPSFSTPSSDSSPSRPSSNPSFRKTLSETLHRKATLREIRINPLELSISVRGLAISERDAPGTWISAEEIFANLQLASVIRGGPVLSEIRLSKPYVNIVRRPDGSYNFTDLIDEFTKKPAKESKPLKYSFNNIQIVDGSIDFDDGPKKTRHEIRGIQIAVPFISNLPYYVDRYVQPSFAAVVNGKRGLAQGKEQAVQRVAGNHLRREHLGPRHPALPRIRPVAAGVRDPFRVPGRERGRSRSRSTRASRPPSRAQGDVILKEVRVLGKDKSPMVRLPLVKAVISPSDLAARDFHLAALLVQDPEIDVSIDRNGKLNLLSLVPKEQKESAVEEKGEKNAPKEASGVKEQKFTVDSIRLTGGKVRFADVSLGFPFQDRVGRYPGRRKRSWHRAGEEGRRPGVLFDRSGRDVRTEGKPVPFPPRRRKERSPSRRWP